MPVQTSAHFTYGTLASDLAVEGGASVRVDRILVANDSGADQLISVEFAAAATVYFKIASPAGQTVVVEAPFIADQGVKIAAESADFHVTVFHSAAGV